MILAAIYKHKSINKLKPTPKYKTAETQSPEIETQQKWRDKGYRVCDRFQKKHAYCFRMRHGTCFRDSGDYNYSKQAF